MELELYLDVLHTIKEILILQKSIILKLKVVEDKSNNKNLNEAYIGDGKIINSDFLNGLNVENAKTKIIEKIQSLSLGKKDVI